MPRTRPGLFSLQARGLIGGHRRGRRRREAPAPAPLLPYRLHVLPRPLLPWTPSPARLTLAVDPLEFPAYHHPSP